uniref:Periplasmic binding protein n=1 Tax=Microbacterium sp. MA1 TaxID=614068 RepID=C3UN01_9MICO|nr:periplasmic binding protein [Microbacterium sp. MA1]
MKTAQSSSTIRPFKRTARLLATAGIATVAVLLAACSAGGGTPDEGGPSAGSGSASGIKVVVMGGAPDDPFWSKMKNGAEAAGATISAAGGSVEVVSMPGYENFNSDAAKLVANIDAMNPSAVVLPNWVPEAQNDNIKTLTDKGIPVIIYNAGQATIDEVGARMYIGTDEYQSGVLTGRQLADDGARNVVCVNTLPGTANIEDRCKGVQDGAEAGGATSSNLNLPSTQFGDPTAITQAIKGTLLQDSSIDAVVAVGAADGDSAAAAIEQNGVADSVQLAAFDFNAAALERITAGTQAFAVDLQPYAQAFYATSAAFQLAAYGIELPEPVFLAGPSLITADNVELVNEAVKNGIR